MASPFVVRFVRSSALLMLLPATACSLLLSHDAPTGGAGGAGGAGGIGSDGGGGSVIVSTASAGGSGGGGDCAFGERFAPPVPSGWNGPVAISEAASQAEAPTCGSIADDFHKGLLGPEAACGCSCVKDASKCDVTLLSYSDGGCATQNGSTVIDSACSGVGGAGSFKWTTKPAEFDVCEAVPLIDVVSPAWQTFARLCLLTAAADGCVQALAGYQARTCIQRSGDLACPANYPVKDLLYEGFDDTRGCVGECTCLASGVTCSGNLEKHSASMCGTLTGPEIANACFPSSGVAAVMYSPIAQGSCTVVNNAAPRGMLVATGTRTVCCTD